MQVLEITFEKDAKNKLRFFYKKYFKLIEAFLDYVERNYNPE